MSAVTFVPCPVHLLGLSQNRRCCSSPGRETCTKQRNSSSRVLGVIVFSCNTRLLSKLLEAGGRTYREGHQGTGLRLELRRNTLGCVTWPKHMSAIRSLSKSQLSRERHIKTLRHSPSFLDFLRPVSDVVFNRKVTAKSFMSDTVQCFGFGEVSTNSNSMFSYSLC
ncbi:inactive serine/threonine-protein kinase TEX14 isoform X1 [Tachysurus ichikawai]